MYYSHVNFNSLLLERRLKHDCWVLKSSTLQLSYFLAHFTALNLHFTTLVLQLIIKCMLSILKNIKRQKICSLAAAQRGRQLNLSWMVSYNIASCKKVILWHVCVKSLRKESLGNVEPILSKISIPCCEISLTSRLIFVIILGAQ